MIGSPAGKRSAAAAGTLQSTAAAAAAVALDDTDDMHADMQVEASSGENCTQTHYCVPSLLIDD